MPDYLLLRLSAEPITDSSHPDLRVALLLTKLSEDDQATETSEPEADKWILTTSNAERVIQELQLVLDYWTKKDKLDAGHTEK